MARPSPEPGLPPAAAAEPRSNFSKMAWRSSRGTPEPLSLTEIETVEGSASARTSIFLSAGGVNFQALLRRLPTACASAARLP